MISPHIDQSWQRSELINLLKIKECSHKAGCVFSSAPIPSFASQDLWQGTSLLHRKSRISVPQFATGTKGQKAPRSLICWHTPASITNMRCLYEAQLLNTTKMTGRAKNRKWPNSWPFQTCHTCLMRQMGCISAKQNLS